MHKMMNKASRITSKSRKTATKHRLSRFFVPNEGELPSNGHSYPAIGATCLFRNCSVRPARMHINRLAHPNRTWNRFIFLAMPRYATFLYPKSRLTMRKACSTLQRIERSDHFYPCFPRDDLFHLVEKFLPLRRLFPVSVFNIQHPSMLSDLSYRTPALLCFPLLYYFSYIFASLTFISVSLNWLTQNRHLK